MVGNFSPKKKCFFTDPYEVNQENNGLANP